MIKESEGTEETSEGTVVIGPPRPDGNWELTPQPSDALDDANITIVQIPAKK